MELLVLRNRAYKTHTIGQLYIDGEFFCFVLEDVVRVDPKPTTPENEGKVHGETAIPEGKYKVTLETSGRFGVDTPTLQNVPGFKYIRVHAGNTAKDTEGCLILGYRLADNGVIAPGTSKPAVLDFKGRLKRTQGDIWITIKNVF